MYASLEPSVWCCASGCGKRLSLRSTIEHYGYCQCKAFYLVLVCMCVIVVQDDDESCGFTCLGSSKNPSLNVAQQQRQHNDLTKPLSLFSSWTPYIPITTRNDSHNGSLQRVQGSADEQIDPNDQGCTSTSTTIPYSSS